MIPIDINNFTNITLPTLAQRFNCYLPHCNITQEIDLLTGVRPIYITYNSNCAIYQDNLIILLAANLLLFISAILIYKHGQSSVKKKM